MLRQKNQNTLLMLAAGFGGSSLRMPIRRSTSAARKPNCFEAVNLCVALGLDVNAVNTQGDTAMHVAAGESIVRFLANMVPGWT